MEAIMTPTWTIDELREAFAKSEFKLLHVDRISNVGEPALYKAEFRLGRKPVTFQFAFDPRFSLSANFDVVREEVADFPPADRSANAFGD